MKCVFMVENDRHCLTILDRHWPDVPKNEIRPCMGLVGGDPCPIRSSASFLRGTIKPDMSGYFLAMVARCKPRWILRENVSSSDVVEFESALAMLGYSCIIIEIDSKAFTGQSRHRQFVAGFDCEKTFNRFDRKCHDIQGDTRSCSKSVSKVRPVLFCLTTRRNRMDHRSHYVWEGKKRGLRLLSHIERESLQGLPAGWTDGIPDSARERTVGNAVTVPVARWLGERIVEAIKL